MEDFTENRFQVGALAAPDHILVATDLTDSDYLVPHTVAQAKASDAHVTLVHAILPSMPLDEGAIQYIDEARVDRDVRLILLGIARKIQSEGVACEIAVRHGYASEVIRKEISRTGATRLIMGTHGRGKMAQIALGSVAKELLISVDVPVFAVGPRSHSPGEHKTPKRLLHPVSFIGDYKKTVCFAIDLAQTYRAELTLLHVLSGDAEKGANLEPTLKWVKNALAALSPCAIDLAPPIHIIAEPGNLVKEIINTAARMNVDWIVLGVHTDSSYWPFQDGTAYKVLAMADHPVLTLRHDAYHSEQANTESSSLAGVVR